MTKQTKIIIFSCLYMFGILTFFSNYLLIFCVILFATILGLMYKNTFSPKFSIILCLIFIVGLINSAIHIKYSDDLTPYTDSNLKLSAKVLTIPTNVNKDKTKFYAKVLSIYTEQGNIDIKNAKTLVTINDTEYKFKNIKIGDTLLMEGSLKSPQTSKNPSQFNYAKYLQLRDTFSLFYVAENWKILRNADDNIGKLLAKLNDTRSNILKIHAKNIKSPMIEVLGGIIFGDDAVNPDNETKKSFINSGIIHILAASGMNVTLIFGIWFFFAKTLRFNYKFSIFSGILLILFYTCMTGFGPPIIRSALMLTLILTGKLIDRKAPTMSLLFMVAFIMLLFSPLMLFDIGFQLSFTVTFALILTAPLLSLEFKHKFLNCILCGIMVPVIAQFFAAPLQIFYFNTFTIYSVLANIAIIPVLSIVSFLGFISSILAMIPVISEKICFIADYILNPLLTYIVKVANFFSSLPFAIIYLKKPTIIQLILYFTIIILIICILRFKPLIKRILSVLVTMFVLFILTFIPIQNKNPEIIFFSVDNADAILIKSPEQEYFLIDSGKLPYKSASSQAKNVIIKYLTDKGIKNINSYIITHFDSDHAGGTIDLFENLKIKNVYISNDYEDTNLSSQILEYFSRNKINPIIISQEKTIYDNENFKISLTKATNAEIKTENQKSIITSIRFNSETALFMGDGDTITYNALPNSFKENITILKSGHHGAKDTINPEMLKNTKLTIISTGKNIYNHPNIETIKLLEENNQTFYRTDMHNAIKVVLNDKELQKYCFSPSKKKFILQN